MIGGDIISILFLLHLNDSEYSNQTKWQAKAGHDSLVV
jgi:hypothetical protein